MVREEFETITKIKGTEGFETKRAEEFIFN